jgi:hypothetical protein
MVKAFSKPVQTLVTSITVTERVKGAKNRDYGCRQNKNMEGAK